MRSPCVRFRSRSSVADSHSRSTLKSAWGLLINLIRFLPVRIVADQLRGHAFTDTIEMTLRWLLHICKTTELTSHEAAPSLMSADDNGPNTDSSSATVEDPKSLTANARSSSKKRRKGSEIYSERFSKKQKTGSSSATPIIQSRPSEDKIRASIRSMITVIRYLEHLSLDSTDKANMAAIILRTTLRTSVQQGARILGASLSILTYVCEVTRKQDIVKQGLYQLTDDLSTIIGFWNFRSTAIDDSIGHASIRAFADECVVPALRLSLANDKILRSFSSMEDTEEVISAKLELEDLITEFVIHPFRIACKHRSDVEQDTPSHDLLLSLKTSVAEEISGLDAESKPASALESISLLYELAIRRARQETAKERITENVWLLKLFVALTQEILSYEAKPDRIIGKPRTETIKRFLQISIYQNMDLSVEILHLIVSRLSGLLNEKDIRLDWEMVGLCLEINPGFVLHHPHKNTKMEEPYGETLNSIFKRISEDCLLLAINNLSRDRMRLLNVVKHLVYGFINFRDLLGFTKLWREQLVSTFADLSIHFVPGQILDLEAIIWQDDILLHTVSNKLEATLVATQICKALDEAFQSLVTSIKSEPLGKVDADLVIVDSLLDGIRSNDSLSACTATASQLYEVISALVIGNPPQQERTDRVPLEIPVNLRWRLWRILATIENRFQATVISRNRESHKSLMYHVEQLMQRLAHETDSRNFSHDLYAFNFVIASPLDTKEGYESNQLDNSLNRQTRAAVRCVCKWLTEYLKSFLGTYSGGDSHISQDMVRWNGERASLISRQHWALACVAILSSSSQALNCLDNEGRSAFFDILYWCGSFQSLLGDRSSMQSDVFSFPVVWEQFLSTSVLEESSSIAQDLRDVRMSILDNKAAVGNFWFKDKEDGFQKAYLVEGLLRGSIQLLRRNDRIKIAGRIFDIIVSSKGRLSPHRLQRYINFVLTCWKSTTITQSVKSPMSLSKLREDYDHYHHTWGDEALMCFSSLRRLIRAVVRHIVAAAQEIQENERSNLLELYKKFDHTDKDVGPRPQKCEAMVTGVFLEEINKTLSHHASSDWQYNGLSPEQIREIRHDHCQDLMSAIAPIVKVAGHADAMSTWLDGFETHLNTTGTWLESLETYSDILRSVPADAQVWGYLTCLALKVKRLISQELLVTRQSLLGEANPTIDSAPLSELERILVQINMLKSLKMADDKRTSRKILEEASLLSEVYTTSSKQRILRKVRSSLHVDLSPEKGVGVLLPFSLEKDKTKLQDNEDQLIFLQSVLVALKISGMDTRHREQMDPALKVALSSILCNLKDSLPKSRTSRACILNMHCIDTFLQKKAYAVTQWHIESLLSTLTTMASPAGPNLDGSSGGNIFISVCRLLGTILTHHRSKLGGRNHLLVPALQSLLQCLFVPYTTGPKPNDPLPEIPWLCVETKSEKTHLMLTATHSTTYARLLTLICDPTLSAVTTSKNRNQAQLNDATKKARSIAGQHLPALIQSFCLLQLQGHLPPSVRKELNPGLYAVMDVMTREIMLTMNDAMDTQARSVWKVLYEDWQREGGRRRRQDR